MSDLRPWRRAFGPATVGRVINDEWHRTHRLGSHAPLDERIEWHVVHARVCGCRPMPLRIAHELARRGRATPEPVPQPIPEQVPAPTADRRTG